ncbi:MAG: hypothetical protein U5K69_15380 [Balneolaceae bacterium]|nr:hypothetical protein [Balneolaceae bacterium]
MLKSPDYIKRFRGLKLCMIKKQSYKRSDIEELKSIANFLLSDFDSSIESREISKMIGNKKVYTCPYCLTDNRPLDQDKQCECGRNKYGFIESGNDPKSIGNYLIQMAEAIESAFNQYNSK